MYKSILIATDGSKLSFKAVVHGLELAKALAASVTFVSVTPPNYAGMIGGPIIGIHGLDEQAAVLAINHLKSVAREADTAGVVHDTVHVTNRLPYEGILETATAKDCDLIVMASHGWRGFAALLLGSEAQKVLTHSTIPVLIHR